MRTIAPKLRKSYLFQLLTLALLTPGLILFPVQVTANPSGQQVVAGNVNFQGLGTANLNINNLSNNAIINWQSFSIQSGETTTINQGANAMTLNRVVSGNPTAIYGALNAANGGVLVINPNGIVVHNGGSIDVAGLLTLSTLDISNEDFLNGGNNRFQGTSGAGIRNYGSITSDGGDVVLLGNFLQNAGSVNATNGVVAFGAGGDMLVEQTVNGSTISVLGAGPGGAVGIDNSGTIDAAAAELKAHGNVYALAIKNDGVVRANGYNFKGGKLTLSGGSGGNIINTGGLSARNSDGSGGRISVSGGQIAMSGGSVDASGAAGQVGGSISVTGSGVMISDSTRVDASGSVGGTVTIAGGNASTINGNIDASGNVGNGGSVDISGDMVSVGATSTVDASGATSGGRIRAGGGFQGNDSDIANANSTEIAEGALLIADSNDGDAGEIIVWSDGDTMFRGEVSAQALGNVGNGGFVEVSGKDQLFYFGTASTAAANGNTGRLLLDPTDVVIGSGAGATISDAALVQAVLSNNVVIHTSSPGTQTGNIEVQGGANVVYDSPNSLAFFAHGSIFINGDVKNHGTTDAAGTGNITLVAGWDGTGAAAFSFDPDNPGAANAGPSVSAADVVAGTYGEWGQNNGSVFLNDAALERVEVGSARGETNAFGFNLDLRAGNQNEEFTILGFRRENDMRGMVMNSVAQGVFAGVINGGTAVTMTGDNAGAGPIQLIGDGATDLNGLISAWNTANPGNPITLSAGDGSQTPGTREILTFSNTTNTGLDIDFNNGVTGNINAYAKQDVLLVPNINTNNEEGIKANDRSWVMIGHGGNRENDDNMENLAGTDFGSDSGHISVGNGNNSGNIVVEAGRALVMTSNRAEAFTQIGHGGMGHDDPDRAGTVDFAVSHTFNPSTDLVGISGGPTVGQESRRSIWGDMSGDITVTAGVIDMEGGYYNAAYTMIGHGGERVRGVHSGNIDVTTTAGGILVEAAPESASGGPTNSNDWRWRSNRDQNFAMIGHGGFDSDYTDGIINPRRTLDLPTGGGGALVNVANSSNSGDGIRVDTRTGNAFGHSGDVSVVSAGGIEFRAGAGTDAFAMIGHGGRSTQGDHSGDIKVEALSGNIKFDRDADQINERGRDITNRGERAHVQIGHGGGRYVGGSSGDIDVDATGSIEFYGGRSESYAMIGHGGRGEDGTTWNNGRQRNNQANGTHSGNITVDAGQDIIFRSGFGSRGTSFSQIGHGGYFQLADILASDLAAGVVGPLIGGGAVDVTQTGHNGTIGVTAGGNISFKAGADDLREGQTFQETNAYDSWSVIGHGGYFSKGDHHGAITVDATGDLEMEARGGWDSISIIGANGNDAPRLNNTEDNSRNGFRNYVTIGHGGVDASHNQSADTWNGSGRLSEGIGVHSNSDIGVTVGGNLTMMGALEATAGPQLPVLLLQDNGAGNPNIGAVLNTYFLDDGVTAATPGQGFSQHRGRLQTVTRDNGEVWTLPDPVLSAEDSYAMIGNGGRSSAYRAGVDGDGHRGNVTVDVGGDITMQAGDFEQAVSTGQALRIEVTNYQGIDGAGNTDPLVGGGTLGGAGFYFVGPAIGNNDDLFFPNANGNLDRQQQNDPTQGQRNGVQIGLGGWGARGDHVGNITVTGGGDLTAVAGEGREDFVQIGNGGHDSDGNNNNNLRDGDEGNSGTIVVDIDGKLTLHGGSRDGDVGAVSGNDPTALTAADVTRASYAQIGHGGSFVGGNHSGDVTVNAGTGVEMSAGSGRQSYTQIGHGANQGRSETLSGNITVVTDTGDITVAGGFGVVDSVTATNGLDNTGNISPGREAYSRIGHGGFDNDAQNGGSNNGPGDGGFNGDITVVAVAGSVAVTGGGSAVVDADNDNFRGMDASIGHGGWGTDGDHTGNISVAAGVNVNVTGGIAAREAWGQIGHGGYDSDGNHSGTIDIDAGNNVVLTRGTGLFNPWAKIGHGAQAFGGRNNNGTGTRAGDITISAGLDFNSTGGLVGHVDSINGGDLFAYDSGNTFIGVSRNNPFTGGPGRFITDAATVISSGGFGVGSELRLYMPDPVSNLIADGTGLNENPYTRTPVPSGTRSDETLEPEHTFTTGAFGEVEGTFTPLGAYPVNGFGLYNIYYGGVEPILDLALGAGTETVIPGFDFLPFTFLDLFDSFQRDEILFGYDGYDGQLFSVALEDAVEEEGDTRVSGWAFEEMLDANLGKRRAGNREPGSTVAEDEATEELERRRENSSRKVGRGGLTFYVFEPGTNRLSSYRVFGVPETSIPAAQ